MQFFSQIFAVSKNHISIHKPLEKSKEIIGQRMKRRLRNRRSCKREFLAGPTNKSQQFFTAL